MDSVDQPVEDESPKLADQRVGVKSITTNETPRDPVFHGKLYAPSGYDMMNILVSLSTFWLGFQQKQKMPWLICSAPCCAAAESHD